MSSDSTPDNAPAAQSAPSDRPTNPAADAARSPLGKPVAYIDTYAPNLLFPLDRAPKRAEIGIIGASPFLGADLWTAYELSWLTPRGKPQVALAHITVPCESPAIVESKSFKLYLNSFSMSRFDSADRVRELLVQDLSAACGVRIGVRLMLPEDFGSLKVTELNGTSLDRLDLDCDQYTPATELLTAAVGEQPVTETLSSQLLKSNCLVTGQPDWGSIQISYSGPQIDQAGLLRYLVSFRNHNEFHEQCVERIYMDVMRQCKPTKLSVYARYTRRGGLDINPWRTSHPASPPLPVRTARQ